eukprot:gene17158-19986_t
MPDTLDVDEYFQRNPGAKTKRGYFRQRRREGQRRTLHQHRTLLATDFEGEHGGKKRKKEKSALKAAAAPALADVADAEMTDDEE